ncbi:TIGR02391 family protein [Symmachiella macrocystis]|nr:TIGR02391 family protein [Symmachiella macrocystis]
MTTMLNISDRFKTAQEVLAFPTEILAGFLLEHLREFRTSGSQDSESMLDIHGIVASIVEQYAQRRFLRSADLRRSNGEAWNWLATEGLIALDPDSSNQHGFFITRRGLDCQTHEDVEEYRKRRLLNPDLLHPTVRQIALGEYLIGDFESAGLKAFRKVEIEVRAAGGFSPGDAGVALVRQVFHAAPNAGPLTDTTELSGEQDAMSHLFACAMGRFRNPAAHGTRDFIDPIEAAQLLMFASQLMSIVDERRPSP